MGDKPDSPRPYRVPLRQAPQTLPRRRESWRGRSVGLHAPNNVYARSNMSISSFLLRLMARNHWALSYRFPHLRLRLLQPVRHPHLAVHRRRGGEMLLRLLTLARASIELASPRRQWATSECNPNPGLAAIRSSLTYP